MCQLQQLLNTCSLLDTRWISQKLCLLESWYIQHEQPPSIEEMELYQDSVPPFAFFDPPGLRAEENPPSTIPNEILVTTTHPDIVAITNQTITLVELTIPYNSPECLANAKHRNETKTNYQLALSDLDSHGYPTSLITIEIGALGQWPPSTRASLQQLLPGVPKLTITRLHDQTAAKTIASSHIIFNARPDDVWNSSHPIL